MFAFVVFVSVFLY